jgi:hypothetical protein
LRESVVEALISGASVLGASVLGASVLGASVLGASALGASALGASTTELIATGVGIRDERVMVLSSKKIVKLALTPLELALKPLQANLSLGVAS